MSKVLNDYFVSVFTVEATYENQEINPVQPNLISLYYYNFIDNAVTKTLDKIKDNKTPCPDCTAPRVLKKAKYQISKFLAILFNKLFYFILDLSDFFGNLQILLIY